MSLLYFPGSCTCLMQHNMFSPFWLYPLIVIFHVLGFTHTHTQNHTCLHFNPSLVCLYFPSLSSKDVAAHDHPSGPCLSFDWSKTRRNKRCLPEFSWTLVIFTKHLNVCQTEKLLLGEYVSSEELSIPQILQDCFKRFVYTYLLLPKACHQISLATYIAINYITTYAHG